MLGRTDYDFFPKEQADFFRRKDTEMFSTGATVSIEQEPITDSSNQLHVLQTIKVPFRDGSGEVTHLVGIISDITRIKQAEDMLRTANEELERRVRERTEELHSAQQELMRKERLAALGQLAGGVAHQLRNPLAVIQNAVALLRRAQLDAMAVQAVDIVSEEVQRADRIIHDLLDYARVRSAERRDVSLRQVVDEALAQEQVPASVAVQVAVDERISVCVDPLQVQIALGNVIRNAIEAMPTGGTLKVSADGSADAAAVVVRDTGQGVPEAARARLFDPLVTTKTQGVGLGLSTARNLIEAQGGCIDHLPTEPGASFVIRLPTR
jgi:signal transduction histidine kinase